MNYKSQRFWPDGWLSLLLLGVLLTGLAAACKTTPKIDWNSRIGTCTYDQAVTELGPPDRTATLSDGKTVSEWITRSGGGSSFSFGTGFYGGHGGVGVGQTVGTGSGDRVLRLVFGTNNVLESVSGKR